MNLQQIDQILQETAYVRTGGSPEELKCAEYIMAKCAELGLEARLEAFEVNMAVAKHFGKTVANMRDIRYNEKNLSLFVTNRPRNAT